MDYNILTPLLYYAVVYPEFQRRSVSLVNPYWNIEYASLNKMVLTL